MRNLNAALREIKNVCGDESVMYDPDLLIRYSRDESEAVSVMPDAVVRAKSTEQVVAIMKIASNHEVPITPRSGGTGRVGGSIPAQKGIVLTFESMNAIKGIERADMIAVVEPGVITGELHRAVEAEGLFYPPDPNSLGSCMLGGNVATNAGGPRAFKYGVTREYVLGAQVVTTDGTVLKLGKQTVKGVSGYDLTALIVGSEGTLATITEVTLKLLPLPEAVTTVLVFLPSEESISSTLCATFGKRIIPRCMEFIDSFALDIIRTQAGLPVPAAARSMLLIELDGDVDFAEKQMERCGNMMQDAGAVEVLVAKSSTERERLWNARRELSYSMRRAAKHKLAEDVVVPRSRMADLLVRCKQLSEKHGIRVATYGHAGDGNLHVNFLWDTPEQEVQVHHAVKSMFESVIELGGTLTGEHGIGLLKAPYLHIEQSAPLIELQRALKKMFDPKNILNPGKIFPPTAHGPC